MGRCPTGGGKKTSKQKNRGYACKSVKRAKFQLPHADVIYKAVHQHLKEQAEGAALRRPGKAREISSYEAMIKGDPNQPFNDDLPGGGQFYCMFTGQLRERGGAREAPEDEAVQEGQEEGAQRAEAPRAEGRGGCGGDGRAR